MDGENCPYGKSEAEALIKQCVKNGRIVFTKHFREELANEHLEVGDVHNVLRHGRVNNPPECDAYQRWNYRIEGREPEGKMMAIVFAFGEDDLGILITIFGIRK
jgi:hypothetical protein